MKKRKRGRLCSIFGDFEQLATTTYSFSLEILMYLKVHAPSGMCLCEYTGTAVGPQLYLDLEDKPHWPGDWYVWDGAYRLILDL